ncbi:MAG: flagellin-like hook-associated protein FlgL [Planctomycetota bacterium]|jgi:flagellin-like hook-associated protein FlgL
MRRRFGVFGDRASAHYRGRISIQIGNSMRRLSSELRIPTDDDEITRISESTEFNGIGPLDVTTKTIQLQVGAGTTIGTDTITIENSRTLESTLAVQNSKVATSKNANKAIKRVDRALFRLNSVRVQSGAEPAGQHD